MGTSNSMRPWSLGFQCGFEVSTEGRGFYDITPALRRTVDQCGCRSGVAHLFIHHTSASLIVNENADPAVLRDLETFIGGLVPDGGTSYTHRSEGPDDMPAHIRSVLTQTALTVPVTDGQLGLGTWQGIYLWEHRHAAHRRRVTITIQGSSADGSSSSP